jgi:hypothetical protein
MTLGGGFEMCSNDGQSARLTLNGVTIQQEQSLDTNFTEWSLDLHIRDNAVDIEEVVDAIIAARADFLDGLHLFPTRPQRALFQVSSETSELLHLDDDDMEPLIDNAVAHFSADLGAAAVQQTDPGRVLISIPRSMQTRAFITTVKEVCLWWHLADVVDDVVDGPKAPYSITVQFL